MKYVYKAYHEMFPGLFEREKERILAHISHNTRIEHVGSTAVPGLGGKGIIDIAIATNRAEMESISEQLQQMGYTFRPDYSTPDRLYFKTDLPDPIESTRKYHIHLTYPESKDWKDLLFLRDYLRTHPEAVKEYSEIKKQAALDSHQDGVKYRKLKDPLIKRFLSKNNEISL